MNVLSLVATKSMGKSTSTHVLTNRLLEKGVPVHIIDADPQEHQSEFCSKAKAVYGDLLTYTSWDSLNAKREPAEEMFDIVSDASDKPGVMIIDVQGSDNDLLSQAAGLADLVLVPIILGPLELNAIKQTFKRLKMLERMMKRAIPVRIFFTAVPDVGFKHTLADDVLKKAGDAGFKWLGCNLAARKQFKHLCETGWLVDPAETKPAYLKQMEKVAALADEWEAAVGRALADV